MINTLLIFYFSFFFILYSQPENKAIVFKVSENVMRGKIFSLYGHGLANVASIQFQNNIGQMVAKITPLQTDSAGYFCRGIFPSIGPGSYKVVIEDDKNNLSKPVFINDAQPRWLSDEKAFSGQKLKVVGRNLNASDYGGIQNTMVRLVSSESSEIINVKTENISSYAVDFEIPDKIKNGLYFVEVNTNSSAFGKNWIRLNNASEHPDFVTDTKLQIIEKPNNEFVGEIGVGWINDFSWNKIYDVKKHFGAVGDGVTDDTRAIQIAIDSVSLWGGGVVFVPVGTYKISGLLIDTNIVIKGEDKYKTTILYHNPLSSDSLINNIFESKGDFNNPNSAKRIGKHGVCNLSVKVHSSQNPKQRLAFCELGCGRAKPWPPDSRFLTAQNLFVYNCNVELGLNSGIWYGFQFGGEGPVLVSNNNFIVGSPTWSLSVKRNFIIRNNHIEYCNDQISACSNNFIFEGNEVIGHNIPGVTQNLHGIFTSEMNYGFNIWNSYVANNSIKNMNNVKGNDGEVFCIDSHPWLIKGKIKDATPQSASVSPDFVQDNPYHYITWDEELMALVCDGKGLGQLRRIKNRNFDEKNSRWHIEVDHEWDIIPDNTSSIAVGRFHTGVIFEKNTGENCCAAIQFYNGCIDNVAANNKLENTLGVVVYGWFLKDGYPGMSYFNVIANNIVRGKSSRFDNAWIGERGEDPLPDGSGVCLFGNEFRNNRIDRKDCANNSDYDSLQPGGLISSQSHNNYPYRSILAPLFEDNMIENSHYGVSINFNSVYGAVVSNTKTSKVDKPVNDNGIKTLILE